MLRQMGMGMAFALAASVGVSASQGTVCTVTVNSADEREVFRQYLPEGRFKFVELVERGRPDWLASACEKKVQCDVLLVSGHFAGNEFYSSKFDVSESLPVDEMERVACSASCPDLFANLKEVYLFGCDSLKPEPVRSAAPEIVRGLERAGVSRAEAERIARGLSERHAEASRNRMRRIFANVPVIYGFSSLAPYGRVAGPMLARHFEKATTDEVGTGRPSARLLSMFAPASMVVTNGQRATDANADYRAEACRFYDDGITTAARIGFMQELLGRDMSQVRIVFDRVEKYIAGLDAAKRSDPGTRTALEHLANDRATRERYLHVTRATEDPALRVRMVALARNVAWLTPAEERAELVHTIHDVLAGDSMGFGEVDLVCTLNKDRALDRSFDRLHVAQGPNRPAQAAALACLGSQDAHARTLKALASAQEAEVQIAQAYLRHRPITDESELRTVALGIARMKGSGAQVRALETLARLHVSDAEILDELARLFTQTSSVQVQRAIAEVFIRAGNAALTQRNLAEIVRRHRVKSPAGGEDLIDVLLRRLQGA
jgi:hypothetical protein